MNGVSLCGNVQRWSQIATRWREGSMSGSVPAERIERVILLIRSHKVILDKDLAAMYGVATRDLNKAVSRNIERSPDDFMIQLTRSEFNNLKYQFGTSSWGGARKLPKAFTEQGIAMLSGILRSKRTIQVNRDQGLTSCQI
jgi:hypothetical protein